MTVFENRTRTAYRRKKSRRKMLPAALLLFVVVIACGFAGYHDSQDAEAMMSIWTPERRVCIVEWSDSVPMYDTGK